MKTLIKEVTIINEETMPFPILPHGAGWESTENANLSVVESGEGRVLFSKILQLIEKASQMICLQSFLVQDSEIFDALVNAVKKRNVKVYILSSAEARLKETIEYEEDFIKPRYIELLESKFKNNFVHRVAENFHAKYILIDAKAEPQGFLCTSNFTDNGFFRSPELAVELTASQATELFKIFVYHFWEFATDEQNATKEFEKVQPAKRFTLSRPNEILLTSPNQEICTLNTVLVNSIKKATKSISISTYILDKNQELVRELIDKARSGVVVTLFCRPLSWLYNDHLKELVGAGIKVIMHPLMHGKSLLIDSNTGYVFTANLILNGLQKGFEVGLKLSDIQVKDLITIHQAWSSNFPLEVRVEAKVNALFSLYEFSREGSLEELPIRDDKKEIESKVTRAADLKSFFNQPLSPLSKHTKETRFRLIAKLESLPNRYKPVGTGSFEIIEHDNGKNGKEEVIVLRDSFDVAAISQLENYLGLRLYCEQ